MYDINKTGKYEMTWSLYGVLKMKIRVKLQSTNDERERPSYPDLERAP